MHVCPYCLYSIDLIDINSKRRNTYYEIKLMKKYGEIIQLILISVGAEIINICINDIIFN